MPAEGRGAIKAACRAIDGLARVRTGSHLAQLGAYEREQFMDRLESSVPGAAAVELLKASILLVAGADEQTDDLISRSRQSAPARPDPRLNVIESTWWPSKKRVDVVVIGSGAGGAMVARTLARSGMDVVVVEEGRRWTVEEFRSRAPIERFAELYRGAGATIALGLPPVILPIGRGVGGTTLVNSGTCFRTPNKIMQRWRDYFGLGWADPDTFDTYLDDVEETLQVGPVPMDVMGRNGKTILAGAEKLGWAHGPLLRNAPGCGGCCQCAIGCPRNAKFGVHLNALPQACDAGARIVSHARVVKILQDEGTVQGVLARRPDGSTFAIEAADVVVACGATETPPLLRRSGLGSHPRLGHNLALHPAVGCGGRFEEPIVGWEGVLQSAMVSEFHESHGMMIEATATPPGMGSMTLPGTGKTLLSEMAGMDHVASVGAMIGDSPSGRVLGAKRSVITYQLAKQDGRRLIEAMQKMGEILFAAGAYEVLLVAPGAPAARSVEELRDTLNGLSYRKLHVTAFHPTGTVAAGADPQFAPVTPAGELRGARGAWVADACILPSCPEVNPQVSIMAAAQVVADEVVAARG